MSVHNGVLPVKKNIYHLPVLERYPELLHGISTRISPDGTDWNLSSKRGTPENPPDSATALRNRRSLAEQLGTSLERMVVCQQVHGTLVVPVGEADAGRGMYSDRPSIQGADGMVTDTPGLYLLALSADCPPVFLYDPERKVVGLVHSGWKGTVGRVAARGVEAMSANFGSRPQDVVAAIGPGIGPCCYEVGENVVQAVEESFPGAWHGGAPLLEMRAERVYFDLWGAIRRALLEAGVPLSNISMEQVCTAHNLDTFYSHRGEAGRCGLFGGVFGLRG